MNDLIEFFRGHKVMGELPVWLQAIFAVILFSLVLSAAIVFIWGVSSRVSDDQKRCATMTFASNAL